VVIQLYIEGQRVELFKDESVTITDSIQNVKDIEKVFTAFTQSFSVPASKTNNKIFKHYYNFDITNGFDARKKVTATIELNNIPFRTGKIKLEGVDLKNNKPHTYRITFFGDIVDLKDKLGEKKLSDLDLTAYNLTYDAATVETKLTTAESSSNHIIAPLITHSQRLFYDSGVGHAHDDQYSGNLHYDNGAGHEHGVKWNELKYAIRVNKIIEQIETDFDLEFSNDFFKNTSLEEFDHLFLWLHRKSGAVEDLSGSTAAFETQVDGWTPSDDGDYSITTTTFTVSAGVPLSFWNEFQLVLSTASATSYNVEIFNDGTSIYSETGITGNHTANGFSGDFEIGDGDYTVFITASAAITFTSIVWSAEYEEPFESPFSISYSTGSYTTNAAFTFNVNKQIPDIKILDFLTGLFKTFNLTAFVVNGVIQVKPLDDFYTGTDTYDITEFVDANSSKVDVALPYREIEFKFKDTKTFLANKFGELNNRDWGSVKNPESKPDFAGQLYKIEVPFGHLLYEKLNDADDGSPLDIQWGYNVDKSQNAYLGSPLLFYPILVSTGGISFVDAVNADNVATSHKNLTSVNLPFNSVSNNSATNDFQLNFNREASEWSGDTDFADTLFSVYYSNYIASVFNTKQRLTKLKAYLPMRILLNYSLGDRFIVAGNQYKINSISTNLLTGESNIELLNDL